MTIFRKNTGFTLIELLTAIAIIGILIGLISPALRMSRGRAKTVECMNNLKQIANLVSIYEIDTQSPASSINLATIETHFSGKVPEKVFKCPLDDQKYSSVDGMLGKNETFIKHDSNPHGDAVITLTGLLSVDRGTASSAGSGTSDPGTSNEPSEAGTGSGD